MLAAVRILVAALKAQMVAHAAGLLMPNLPGCMAADFRFQLRYLPYFYFPPFLGLKIMGNVMPGPKDVMVGTGSDAGDLIKFKHMVLNQQHTSD